MNFTFLELLSKDINFFDSIELKSKNEKLSAVKSRGNKWLKAIENNFKMMKKNS